MWNILKIFSLCNSLLHKIFLLNPEIIMYHVWYKPNTSLWILKIKLRVYRALCVMWDTYRNYSVINTCICLPYLSTRGCILMCMCHARCNLTFNTISTLLLFNLGNLDMKIVSKASKASRVIYLYMQNTHPIWRLKIKYIFSL